MPRRCCSRDRDYVVRDGRVEIVDEWTGRVADNRRWPHGIQPAVEAKEGVTVQRKRAAILGSIPMQHFVRLYRHLAGMTATAEPAAEEFAAFFGLRTVVFPPHRTCRRVDEPDVVFTSRAAKYAALCDEIARVHASGRPILVGTTSVRESEELGRALEAARVECRVLNARQDAHEAAIIASAGDASAPSRSRRTWPGAAPTSCSAAATPCEHGGVAALGGLYVIGTNRHESRRIDDQLRGRAGRQGDPGSSRFFISLEDDLIRRYGVMSLIPEKHRPSAGRTAVDDPIVAREIARAQRIVEGQNFEIRRTLWKYSALVEEQRRIVYRLAPVVADCRVRIPTSAKSGVPGALRRADRGSRDRTQCGESKRSLSGTCSTIAGRIISRHRGRPRRHPSAAVTAGASRCWSSTGRLSMRSSA